MKELSSREKQIARLIRDGCYQVAEQAKILGISEKTVKNYRHSLFVKMEVSEPVELVRDLLLPLDSPLRVRNTGEDL